MAVHRFEISANKKAAVAKQQTREIAVMLDAESPKEEKAMIRAEGLIREERVVEAYEILQLSCELLVERVKLIGSTKECPADLVSSISTLIWAADRVDIRELSIIKKILREKYGKNFEEDALKNKGKILNERIVEKLSFEPPSEYVLQCYLEQICEQYEVDWKPKHPVPPDEIDTSELTAPTMDSSYQYVVTGTTDSDSDSNYNKRDDNDKGGHDGGGFLPTAIAHSNWSKRDDNGNGGHDGGDDLPTAVAQPVSSTAIY